MGRIFFPNSNAFISANLTSKEVQNASDVAAFDIDERLPKIFELVRKYSGGTPLSVSSSYRSEQKNDKVGGTLGSSHTRGNAFDIPLNPTQKGLLRGALDRFLFEAVSLGLSGFGVYPTHIHIDTERDKVVNWWAIDESKTGYFIRHWSDRGEPEWLKWKQNPGSDFSDDEKVADAYSFDGSQYTLLLSLAGLLALTYFLK